MTIDIYPAKIEAYDHDTKDLLFTVEAFDEGAAKIEIMTVVSPDTLDEILAAISKAVGMLALKSASEQERE